jgi:hypothetical protein
VVRDLEHIDALGNDPSSEHRGFSLVFDISGEQHTRAAATHV